MLFSRLIAGLIALFNLVMARELNMLFTFEDKLNDITYFDINADFNKASYSTPPVSFVFCNLLNEFRQLVLYLYPSNSVIRPNYDEQLKCFTNQRVDLSGRYVISIILANVNQYPSDFKNHIRVSAVDYEGRKFPLKILSIELMYQPDRTTGQHMQIRAGEFIEVETKYGFKMFVEEDDNTVSLSIREYGIWQNNIAKILCLITQNGDSVLHLGGHIGTFDVLFAHLVGASGKVVVYEPMPKSFHILSENLRINHVDHIVTAIPKGAYSENTKREIEFVPLNTGASYITKSQNLESSQFIAELVTIDSDLPNFKIDVLMMDIEGCEIHAFNGMIKTLQGYKRPIMVWEWGFKMIKENSNNEFGDYNKVLDELSLENDIFIIDLFENVLVKISVEFLKNPEGHGNFDILIVPHDHKLSIHINGRSIIMYPPAPYSDFNHSRHQVVTISLKNLRMEECERMINANKYSIQNKSVICKVRNSSLCSASMYYWCSFTTYSYTHLEDL